MTDYTDAACRPFVRNGNDLWHEPDREGTGHNETREEKTRRVRNAKAICRTCPLINACLEHAKASGEEDGIRGALTPQERLQDPGTHGTVSAYRRHRRHQDPPCDSCAEAKRTNDRNEWAAREGTA